MASSSSVHTPYPNCNPPSVNELIKKHTTLIDEISQKLPVTKIAPRALSTNSMPSIKKIKVLETERVSLIDDLFKLSLPSLKENKEEIFKIYLALAKNELIRNCSPEEWVDLFYLSISFTNTALQQKIKVTLENLDINRVLERIATIASNGATPAHIIFSLENCAANLLRKHLPYLDCSDECGISIALSAFNLLWDAPPNLVKWFRILVASVEIWDDSDWLRYQYIQFIKQEQFTEITICLRRDLSQLDHHEQIRRHKQVEIDPKSVRKPLNWIPKVPKKINGVEQLCPWSRCLFNEMARRLGIEMVDDRSFLVNYIAQQVQKIRAGDWEILQQELDKWFIPECETQFRSCLNKTPSAQNIPGLPRSFEAYCGILLRYPEVLAFLKLRIELDLKNKELLTRETKNYIIDCRCKTIFDEPDGAFTIAFRKMISELPIEQDLDKLTYYDNPIQYD